MQNKIDEIDKDYSNTKNELELMTKEYNKAKETVAENRRASIILQQAEDGGFFWIFTETWTLEHYN